MSTYRVRAASVLAAALLSVFGWISAGIAQSNSEPEKFSASYVDINTGRSGPLQIAVTRWSTAAERAKLQKTLFKQGQEAMLDTLRDMPSVGRISTPGNIGWDLRYAEQRALPDGGREIILATDRPMSIAEIMNKPRSSEYPFTWLQFRVQRDGTGQGKVAVAARITGEEADDLIEVEDFALQPVRLENIQSEKARN